MTVISEEAVNAAHEAYDRVAAINPRLSYSTRVAVKAALTAALPFLPVQGAVNIDAIVQPLEDIHAPGGLCRWTEVATAIGEVRRSLSALEPSAARELALEEIIALCRDYGEDSQPDSEYRLACNDIIEAIQERRALSSPDHADAGKVEGDGWYPGCDRLPTLQEAAYAAKVLNACNGYDLSVWSDDFLPNSDTEDGLRAIIAHSLLPSAPASEGAE